MAIYHPKGYFRSYRFLLPNFYGYVISHKLVFDYLFHDAPRPSRKTAAHFIRDSDGRQRPCRQWCCNSSHNRECFSQSVIIGIAFIPTEAGLCEQVGDEPFTSVVSNRTKQHFPEQVLTDSGLGAIPLIHLIYLWEHGANLLRKPCAHDSPTVYLMADYQFVTSPVGREYITAMIVYTNPTFSITISNG